MIAPLSVLVVASSCALALWAAWYVIRDRAVVLRQLWGGAVVEALLVVQAVVALVLVLRGHPLDAPGEFWGYVLTQLLILPFAAAWAFAERTRWSSVVLLVAAVTVAFLEYRLLILWGA